MVWKIIDMKALVLFIIANYYLTPAFSAVDSNLNGDQIKSLLSLGRELQKHPKAPKVLSDMINTTEPISNNEFKLISSELENGENLIPIINKICRIKDRDYKDIDVDQCKNAAGIINIVNNIKKNKTTVELILGELNVDTGERMSNLGDAAVVYEINDIKNILQVICAKREKKTYQWITENLPIFRDRLIHFTVSGAVSSAAVASLIRADKDSLTKQEYAFVKIATVFAFVVGVSSAAAYTHLTYLIKNERDSIMGQLSVFGVNEYWRLLEHKQWEIKSTDFNIKRGRIGVLGAVLTFVAGSSAVVDVFGNHKVAYWISLISPVVASFCLARYLALGNYKVAMAGDISVAIKAIPTQEQLTLSLKRMQDHQQIDVSKNSTNNVPFTEKNDVGTNNPLHQQFTNTDLNAKNKLTKNYRVLWSDEEIHKMEMAGWKFNDVLGDGSCLFHAVAASMGKESEGLHLRDRLLDDSNSKYFDWLKEKLNLDEKKIHEYKIKMIKPTEWAGDNEIEGLSQMLQRRIIVVHDTIAISDHCLDYTRLPPKITLEELKNFKINESEMFKNALVIVFNKNKNHYGWLSLQNKSDDIV